MTLAITVRGSIPAAFAARGRAQRYERWWDRTREALRFWPESWFVDGQVVIEATETPRSPWGRRIATVALPHTIQWRPRFLGYATRGITAHEAAHLFQLQPGPGRDALQTLAISRPDQLRLSYNGSLLEGIPYIIQRAMGTRPGWENLRTAEPAVAAALLEWFAAHTIRGPEWIAEELGMTTAPDIPTTFPATTLWVPAFGPTRWNAAGAFVAGSGNWHAANGRGYGGRAMDVQGVCLHTPEEPADDRESTPIYFGSFVAAATGYYGDSDGDLYQMVRDVDMPWAQGTRTVDLVLPRPSWWRSEFYSYNTCLLSYEIEGYAASIGRTFFEGSPQFETCAQWVALKAAEFDFPIDREHVLGHNELNKQKRDPGALPWGALLRRARAIAGSPAPDPDLGFVARLERLQADYDDHWHLQPWPDEDQRSGPPQNG